MWRKATCDKLATFAALAVASSMELLTGAQAASLDFGPPTQSANIPFVRIGATGGFQLWLPPIGVGANGITVMNLPPQTGPASVSGLSSGSYTFPVSAASNNALAFTDFSGNGVFGAANFCITCPGFLGPVAQTFAFSGGGNSLTATVNINQFMDSATGPLGTGDYTITAISGDPSFVSNFGGMGGTGTFDLSFLGSSTTLASLAATPSPTNIILPTAAGSLTPPGGTPVIPLPPAIYLFGTALGGVFWLGRRKRSAVSSLGTA